MLSPDPGEVRAINAMLAERLGAAFDHVLCEVLGQSRPDRWSTAPAAHALQAMIREAAVAGDMDAVRTLCTTHAAVLTAPEPPGRLRVVGWGDASLTASERDLLQAAFRDDIGLTAALVPPAEPGAARFVAALPRMMGQLARALPLWAEEMEALVAEVILAETPAGGFAGASAFAAWGAVLVNPGAQADDLSALVTLVHESSHLKLFSAYVDDEIVLNDPDETYASPLRVEARPMNGIYHAAFVLARMVIFMDDLRQSGQAAAVVGEVPAARLEGMLARTVGHFEAARDEIRRHGQLTPLGRSIMDEAADAVGAVGLVQAAT